MSGGHWDYMQEHIQEASHISGEALRLLAVIEHELDWGHSGDSCLECARLRCVAAIEAFFDARLQNADACIALARDRLQNQCGTCLREAAGVADAMKDGSSYGGENG